MKIELGNFAREGIEARLGADAEAGARTAMLRYADRLGSTESPLPLPEFLPDRAPSEDLRLELELDLDVEVKAALEREAARQMVPLDRIASHAVLTYLAELDAVGAVCEAASPTS
jgi:hypothetical protein